MGETARRRLLLCSGFGVGLAAAALAAAGADYEVIPLEDLDQPVRRMGLRGRDDLGASGPPLTFAEPGGRRRRSGLSPADRLMARSRDRARRAR